MDFRYFSSVKGRAFPRPRTDTYIGCQKKHERDDKGKVISTKFVWDTEKIVAVPASEVAQHLKTWDKGIKAGDVVELDAEAAEKAIKAAERAVAKKAKEAKAAKEAETAAAEKAAKAAAKAKADEASASAGA